MDTVHPIYLILSGEQYPFLLLSLMNDWILFRSVALAKPSQALDA